MIYKKENEGQCRIFGEEFLNNNKNNIELIINGVKSKLIDECNLKEGNNNIKLLLKMI